MTVHVSARDDVTAKVSAASAADTDITYDAPVSRASSAAHLPIDSTSRLPTNCQLATFSMTAFTKCARSCW